MNEETKVNILTKLKDATKPAIVAGVVGGGIATGLYLQDTKNPNIETTNIERSQIANLETSEVSRADLAQPDPEITEIKREDLPEKPPLKIIKIENDKVVVLPKVKETISKIKEKVSKVKEKLSTKDFHDTEDPEPYDVFMKTRWDGNFLYSEGVNARFGKYKKRQKY